MADSSTDGGPLFWALLRQTQAVREALIWSLGGGAIPASSASDLFEWMGIQGIPVAEESRCDPAMPIVADRSAKSNKTTDSRPLITVLETAVDSLRWSLLGKDALRATELGQLAAQSSDDFGTRRSGAGWTNVDNFCITSAFVRLLGAHEQFELDVLKALFYYRPSGELLGHEDDHETQLVDKGVPLEIPEKRNKKPRYNKPPLWTWMKKFVENNETRHQVFDNVFQIKATPPIPGRDYNNKRKSWYDKRNAIAHGRVQVLMTLHEYFEVETYVFHAASHIAEECRTKLKIVI